MEERKYGLVDWFGLYSIGQNRKWNHFPHVALTSLIKKSNVSHLMTLKEATVIPSIINLGVISLGQTQPGKVYGRLEIT